MTGRPASSAQYLAAAILLIISGLVAWCVMVATDHDPNPLLEYLGLPIVGLLLAAKVDLSHTQTIDRLSEQDRQLGQITHQTNGVLTERIEAAVTKALAVNGPVSPTDPPH